MVRIPSKGTSLWVESAPSASYSPLNDALNVDIAVIGGGIAGLTAAYLLKQRGKQVAVFDKWQIGGDISDYTTGKITSQHGIAYSSLIKDHGRDVARLYGKANQAALKQIETIIRREAIDCDWRRLDNYVFTTEPGEVEKFRQEAADARALGLPAEFQTDTPLPFPVEGAVRFRDQATFHVGKYLQGLAGAIDGNGCRVYEGTKVTNIRDGARVTFQAGGHTVTANAVVIATNVPSPLIMHGVYAFYEYPSRSYIVAGKIDHDIEGMYINDGRPSRSILPVRIGDERWLLVGGEGHFAGMSGPAQGRYAKLADYAKQYFGIQEITYRWSTWDYVAYDHLPLVGKAYPFSRNVYVATGLRKWGLSNGTAAAMILADTLTGKMNRYAPAFRSNRLSAFTSLPKGAAQGLFQ